MASEQPRAAVASATEEESLAASADAVFDPLKEGHVQWPVQIKKRQDYCRHVPSLFWLLGSLIGLLSD